MALFWESTEKGPELPSTVIDISSVLFAEPLALLSRTVNLKFKVLATPGNTSTGISKPEVVTDPVNRVIILGKYRIGEVTGGYDLKRGPIAAVVLGTVAVAFPKSISSHEYVRVSSVLASVAAPVNRKGVPLGIL